MEVHLRQVSLYKCDRTLSCILSMFFHQHSGLIALDFKRKNQDLTSGPYPYSWLENAAFFMSD